MFIFVCGCVQSCLCTSCILSWMCNDVCGPCVLGCYNVHMRSCTCSYSTKHNLVESNLFNSYFWTPSN